MLKSYNLKYKYNIIIMYGVKMELICYEIKGERNLNIYVVFIK